MDERNRSEEIEACLEEIRMLPDLLESALEGLDDRQLDTPYREGGWTVRQVAHHIADAHLNGFLRMRVTLTEEEPTLKTYDQDLWAELPDSRLPVQPSVEIVRGVHRRMAATLLDLPEEALDRRALHPEDGPVTLGDMIRKYAGHGRHHVEQILGLRRRMGW